MTFVPHGSTPLLHDGTGLWCAWCRGRVRDIETDPALRRHYHHVAQRWLDRRLLGVVRVDAAYPILTEYAWDQWVVPSHEACHQQLDAYSQTVAEGILGAYGAPAQQVDGVAGECFNRGDYAIAAMLRQCMRYRFTKERWDEDEQRKQFQFELVAAAGLWFFRCTSLEALVKELPLHLVPDARTRPSYTSYVLNPQTTFGNDGVESLVRHFSDALPGHSGDELRAKAARLLAIATLRPVHADDALTRAEYSAGDHQILTAQVAQVWALFAEGEVFKAYDLVMGLDDTAAFQSWWQTVQLKFTRACLQIACHGEGSSRLAVKWLLQAQYIMVAKGLRGWAVPDVRTGDRRRSTQLYPGHVLKWLVERMELRGEDLDEIRQESLKTYSTERLWVPPVFPWALRRT